MLKREEEITCALKNQSSTKSKYLRNAKQTNKTTDQTNTEQSYAGVGGSLSNNT